MFVPFIFTLDERPWSRNYAQGDIFYIYADACIAYDWPMIAPERYFNRFSKVEDPFWNMEFKDFADYMCMRKIPTTEEMFSINAYGIPQAFEDSIIAKFPSKVDCLNGLLTNENKEFEQMIGGLLDKITDDFKEKPEGILCFEILPKFLIAAADKRGIPVIFQLNGLMRKPLYKLRQHPKASFINCMSLKSNFTLDNIKVKYDRFLSSKNGLMMLSRKGIMRLFIKEEYIGDIHDIDKEPEYDIGILHNNSRSPIHFFGQIPMSDDEMSSEAIQKYEKVLVRTRPGFQKYAKAEALDDSPSSFHFCCKCRRVAGSMTKGVFEAMLVGRIAHEYGYFLFHSFCNEGIDDDSKDVAPLDFINFVVFMMWAPFPWLTEIDHLRLSISESFEKELYIRNFNYFTRGISEETLKIYYTTNCREYRLGDILYFTSGNMPHEYAAYYCTGGLYINQGEYTWSNGECTSFEFDLTEQVDEPLAITVALYEVAFDWVSSDPSQTVNCAVNGVDCGSVTLVPGKKYLKFIIPKECFTNKLQIKLKYSYLHISGDLKIAVAFERMYISRQGQMPIEDAMSDEIAGLTGKVCELEIQKTSLEASVSALEAQNAELITRVAGMNAQIPVLENQKSRLELQISEMQIQNSELETRKTELGQQLSALAILIAESDTQKSELETQVTGLKEQIESIYNSRSWKLGNGVMKAAAKVVPHKKSTH